MPVLVQGRRGGRRRGLQVPQPEPQVPTHNAEVVKALEPVLGMDDFFPAGPFVFTINVEGDKVVGVKVEVEEKPHQPLEHRSHQDRHRQKYPNSSIHAGIVLHSREGLVGGDYTDALRRQRRASSLRQERGP